MATNGKQTTKVIFRYFQGEVIALFPEEPAAIGGYTCSCYGYGGHGSADPFYVMASSRPATPDEYASMKRELESEPYRYNLAVRKRHTKFMRANWQKAADALVKANWGDDPLKGE